MEIDFQGTVTRTSWALNIKSRTLRAEIDLANPESRLLPGMYAYANVIIERPGVRTLPLAALVHSGDQTFYWSETAVGGPRSRRYQRWRVDRGHQSPRLSSSAAPSSDVAWVPIDGTEQVIDGDVSMLTDGTPVRVSWSRAGRRLRVQLSDGGYASDLPALLAQRNRAEMTRMLPSAALRTFIDSVPVGAFVAMIQARFPGQWSSIR